MRYGYEEQENRDCLEVSRRPCRAGVVLNNAPKSFPIFPVCPNSRCCWQPSWRKLALGQSWPQRRRTDRKTFPNYTAPGLPTAGLLPRSRSDSSWCEPGSCCVSVTWTWKHPKSYSRERDVQRDQEKKICWETKRKRFARSAQCDIIRERMDFYKGKNHQ